MARSESPFSCVRRENDQSNVAKQALFDIMRRAGTCQRLLRVTRVWIHHPGCWKLRFSDMLGFVGSFRHMSCADSPQQATLTHCRRSVSYCCIYLYEAKSQMYYSANLASLALENVSALRESTATQWTGRAITQPSINTSECTTLRNMLAFVSESASARAGAL